MSDLLGLIESGDAAGVARQLAGLGDSERAVLAPIAVRAVRRAGREHWERVTMELEGTGRVQLGSRVEDAAATAALATGTLDQLQMLGSTGVPPAELALGILAAGRPGWTQAWLERLALGDWTLLDGLVGAGLAEVSPCVVVALPGILMRSAPRDVPLDRLIEGRTWVIDSIWQLFEIEGSGSSSLAACDKYAPKNSERTFALAFELLASRGVLDRQRLLDCSLDALTRGFSAFRSGWFSRFHERLAPTLGERAARESRYLNLLAAPVPATVTLAIDAVQALLSARRISPALVAAALRAGPEPPSATARKRASALLRRALSEPAAS